MDEQLQNVNKVFHHIRVEKVEIVVEPIIQTWIPTDVLNRCIKCLTNLI